MPWALPFRFRAGQLTIWQGYTSGGKTVCQTYVFMTLAAKYARRICIASLEIPARKTFKNIARQAMGKAKPTDRAELDRVLQWMDRHFWVYDHVGDVSIDSLLDVFQYAARKYGINHFAVDSLMKISDVTTEDYDAQKMLVGRLFDYANEFGVHVHLVAHSKKPDSRKPAERYWPSKYDISGSATLANIPDNIVCVWRNVKKEQELEALESRNDEDADDERYKLKQEEDALFIVQKQRETGDEPIKRLWFDAGDEGSWQYREKIDGVRAVRYAP